jgi:hypothetical protein
MTEISSGMAKQKWWNEPFARAKRAVLEWALHCSVLASFLIGFRSIELLITWLWGPDPRLFFDIMPVRYIFDGADCGLLVGFLTYGVFRVLQVYKDSPDT